MIQHKSFVHWVAASAVRNDVIAALSRSGRPEHGQQEPLVVHATAGIFSTSFLYLSSYKGLAFFTKSPAPMDLPSGCEVVQAQKIWIPG
jgi:hypothetical protein